MPTLDQARRTFLQIDRAPLSNAQYGHILHRLVSDIGPTRSVELVTYEDLLDWIAHRRGEGLKPLTLAHYVAVIKSFFSWCVERNYIPSSPAADIKSPRRLQQRDNRAVPPHELAAMIEYARVTSPRNYAIMLFLADTGCRVGGLVSLTLENLDLFEDSAWLLEKGHRWHKALFGEQTAAAIQSWLQRRPQVGHAFVWTGQGPDYAPLVADSIAAIVRRLAVRTGASRIWSPHAIRHAVGHAYARAGLPVTVTQRKLGHADPAVTMRHYYPDGDDYLAQISHTMPLLAAAPENKPGKKVIPFRR